MYWVLLECYNEAGLNSSIFSHPILVDAISPKAGAVKNGLEYTGNTRYQSSQTMLNGRHIVYNSECYN